MRRLEQQEIGRRSDEYVAEEEEDPFRAAAEVSGHVLGHDANIQRKSHSRMNGP